MSRRILFENPYDSPPMGVRDLTRELHKIPKGRPVPFDRQDELGEEISRALKELTTRLESTLEQRMVAVILFSLYDKDARRRGAKGKVKVKPPPEWVLEYLRAHLREEDLET